MSKVIYQKTHVGGIKTWKAWREGSPATFGVGSNRLQALQDLEYVEDSLHVPLEKECQWTSNSNYSHGDNMCRKPCRGEYCKLHQRRYDRLQGFLYAKKGSELAKSFGAE